MDNGNDHNQPNSPAPANDEQIAHTPQAAKFPTTAKYLFLLSIALPVIGWGLGAMTNPDGWMSDPIGLLMAAILPFLIVGSYLSEYLPGSIVAPLVNIIFVAIIIAAIVTYSRLRHRIQPLHYTVVGVVVFMASVIWSLYIFRTTASADDSEFTG